MGLFGRKKNKKKEAETIQKQKVTVDELIKMYLPDSSIGMDNDSEIGEEAVYEAMERGVKAGKEHESADMSTEDGNIVLARYIIDKTKQMYVGEDKDFKDLKNDFADTIRKAVVSTKSMAEYPNELLLWAENDMTPSEVKAYKCSDADIAIRTMPIGAMFDEPEDVLKYVICSAIPTHGSPEGIKCAAVSAMCVYLACHKASKRTIMNYVLKYYPGTEKETLPADITLNSLVVEGKAIHSQEAPVVIPEALACFMESFDFDSAMLNATSFPAETVKVAAIAAGFIGAFYGK